LEDCVAAFGCSLVEYRTQALATVAMVIIVIVIIVVVVVIVIIVIAAGCHDRVLPAPQRTRLWGEQWVGKWLWSLLRAADRYAYILVVEALLITIYPT
jgi:threonine/homoserine/homoserine lactone efflux protein